MNSTKRVFFVFGLTLITNFFLAQLSGTAFLGSQSNHAGIKVKFKANPGTSVTDSTLTDAAGNYSINIVGGSYNVEFGKTGFQTVYYNSNQAVILTNTITLSSVTLSPGNVVSVSPGNVSGTWLSSNIYVVNGDIAVPFGSTLTIDPGTTIKFNGAYTLTANGVLKAIGTPNNRILFTSNILPANSNDWKGIQLNSSLSEIKYSTVEYAYTAIYAKNCSPKISYNKITKFDWVGIDLDNSSAIVTNNEIFDYNSQYYSIGIQLYGSTPLVECNTMYNGKGRGIRTFSRGIIRNNVIYSITDPQRGYGIDCGSMDSCTIRNNIIHDCVMGILIGDNISPIPKPNVINNTIFSNTIGIHMYENYANPSIINNLVINNIRGIVQDIVSCPPLCSTTPSVVSHNNVWNNSSGDYVGVQVLGVGQNVSTNSNGDPVDSYFNISKDPLFAGGQPPYLGSGSPCYNAGNSAYSSTIGVNTNSFCAGVEIGIAELEHKVIASVFPNPFSDHITVRTSIEVYIKMFDIVGKEVSIACTHGSSNGYEISSNNVQPGIYFLQIASGKSKQTVKLIKN